LNWLWNSSMLVCLSRNIKLFVRKEKWKRGKKRVKKKKSRNGTKPYPKNERKILRERVVWQAKPISLKKFSLMKKGTSMSMLRRHLLVLIFLIFRIIRCEWHLLVNFTTSILLFYVKKTPSCWFTSLVPVRGHTGGHHRYYSS